jgi:hypothetical protein
MEVPKTLSIIVVAAMLCAAPLAAQKDEDKIIESAWTSAPVQIDGSNADWPPESVALLNDPAAAAALGPYRPFKFGIEWGGLTAEMRKARAGQMGDQAVRASGEESSFDAQVSGGYEGGRDYSPDSSLMGMRGRPKQYSFWINLKISESK